jgi:hypothetical protein
VRVATPVILISQVNTAGQAEGRRQTRHDVTFYSRMWKHPNAPPVRFFKLEKTRHGGRDGFVHELRKEETDGRLVFVRLLEGAHGTDAESLASSSLPPRLRVVPTPPERENR